MAEERCSLATQPEPPRPAAGWRRLLNDKRFAAWWRIAVNFQWLSLGTVAFAGSTVLTNALLARKMGAWSFGEWALVASTASWATVVRSGVGQHLTRLSSISPELARTLLFPSWFLMVLLGVILGVAGVSLNVSLQSPALALASLLAIGGTFLSAASGMIGSIFAGREQMYWSLADGVQALVVLLILLAMPARHLSSETVAWVYLIASASVAVPVAIIGIRRLRPVMPARFVSVARELIAENIWLVGIQFLAIFHLSVDLFLLQSIRNTADVGVFSAALKVIVALRLLPWLLMMSLIPRLSRSLVSDARLASKVWAVVTHVLLPLVGVVVIVLTCSPGIVLSTLYTRSFSSAALPLAILGLSLIPHCLWQVLSATVMAKGRYRSHFWASAVCCFVHVCCSALLIPRSGVTGAAGAFLIGESVAFLSLAAVYSRTLESLAFSPVLRFAGCLGASLAVGTLILRLGVFPSAACMVVVTCYLILLFSFGLVSKGSIRLAFRGSGLTE